ncbi:alpha-glucosidase C-terminal domain-containing protein [Bacillus sp. N9]
MEVLYENNGMVIFKREYEGETVVVAINNTTKDQSVSIPVNQFKENQELRGLIGTDMVRTDTGEFNIFVGRETSEIYKVVPKSGYNLPFIFSIFFIFIAFAIFLYIAWKRGKNKLRKD